MTSPSNDISSYNTDKSPYNTMPTVDSQSTNTNGISMQRRKEQQQRIYTQQTQPDSSSTNQSTNSVKRNYNNNSSLIPNKKVNSFKGVKALYEMLSPQM